MSRLPGQAAIFFLALALFPQGTTANAEIEKLIKKLSDASFAERETASKKLEEIGVPALPALQKAEENSDTEVRVRTAIIAKSIRAKNHLPARIKGMEFKVVTDKEWIIPDPKGKTALNIKLEITNTTKSSFRFRHAGNLLLFDSAHTSLLKRTGRERAALQNFETLEPGKTLTISYKAELYFSKNQLIFAFANHESDVWVSKPLGKGQYDLSVMYEFLEHSESNASPPNWIGSVVVDSEPVTIKEKE